MGLKPEVEDAEGAESEHEGRDMQKRRVGKWRRRRRGRGGRRGEGVGEEREEEEEEEKDRE